MGYDFYVKNGVLKDSESFVSLAMTPSYGEFVDICEIETDKDYRRDVFKFFEKYKENILECLYPRKVFVSSFYEGSFSFFGDDIVVLKIPFVRVRLKFSETGDFVRLKVLK